MQFKNVAIGGRFIFASERSALNWPGARGPWIKVSARGYVREEMETITLGAPGTAQTVRRLVHGVGTVKVSVFTL
jgi:hypothetical protein